MPLSELISQYVTQDSESILLKIKLLGEGKFKDSKVRDSDGQLRLVWHGSPRMFDQFDTMAKGEYRWRNTGVHFQSEKVMVKQYAEKAHTALMNVLTGIGGEEVGRGMFNHRNPEHIEKAVAAYNKVIQSLLTEGNESSYYTVRSSVPSIKYGRNQFGTEWFTEIFGGSMPNSTNTELRKGFHGQEIYFGKDINKVYYAALLNITTPFSIETDNIDYGFELGEESHKQKGTDGTILFHPTNIQGMGGEIPGSAGSSSYAVFDPNNIIIVGREVNGEFTLTDSF